MTYWSIYYLAVFVFLALPSCFMGMGMKSQNPVLDDSFVGSTYAILLWMFFIKLSLLCKILQNIKSNCS